MKYNLKNDIISLSMGLLLKQRQNEIDFIIDDIAAKTGVFYPKNSLLDIAEVSGVKVYVEDLAEIGDNVSGAILYKDPKTKKEASIFINKKCLEEDNDSHWLMNWGISSCIMVK